MCLLGFDVAEPEEDLVGFAVEYKEPAASGFQPLLNRLAFSYDAPADVAVTGDKKFSSLEAPFQKFRWIPFSPSREKRRLHVPRDENAHAPGSCTQKGAVDHFNDFARSGDLQWVFGYWVHP